MTFTEYLSEKFNFNLDFERLNYLKNSNKIEPPKIDDAAESIAKMSELSGYDFTQIVKRKRDREIVIVRHVMIYLIYKNFNLTLKSIAKLFGGFHHSSILHAKDNISDLLEIGDKAILETYNKLKVAFDEKV